LVFSISIFGQNATIFLRAFTSGCATYYNTAKKGNSNTIMKRFFKENRFEIYAVRDIKKDEELTHTYKSLEWREVFSELNTILNQ